jgi:aryl-alcohol dehydrogenase-like predicted oxidoreductase
MGTGDYFWDADISHADKVNLLRHGIDAGVGFIDTAEEYGDGKSEEIVRDAVKGVRDQVIIATKFSPQHNSHADVLAAVDASLRRLGTDYIDLYQVHWTNPAIPLSETMTALRELLDSQKIRAIGVCNFSNTEIIESQSIVGKDRVSALQTEFNLFERTVEYSGLLPYCDDNQISILAYSPLDQGRFDKTSGKQREILETIARKHDKTVPQVILNWLANHGPVVPIVQTTKVPHLNQNIESFDFDLEDTDIEEIRNAYPVNIIEVPTDRIRPSPTGEWGHTVYMTVEEALSNEAGFTPSPAELAENVKSGEVLKPVRLTPSASDKYEYDLIGGRIRYWAWVIAHEGKRPIAAQVRTDL